MIIVTGVWVTQGYAFVKAQQKAHLGFVCFTLCKIEHTRKEPRMNTEL